MDLYEAIEVLSELVEWADDNEMPIVIHREIEMEAIKICLEAARDKAGI